MKWLAASFGLVIVLLQGRLWLSDDGVFEMLRLESAVLTQRVENAALSDRNRQLAAEVRDLKQGYAALEERARNDLGMIGRNETFFQVMPAGAAAPAAQPGSGNGMPLAPKSDTPTLRTAAR